MQKIGWLLPAVALTLIGFSSFAAEEKQSKESEKQALAKDVKTVKVSLEKGLSASEAEGKPISAKFEIEHGKLQLSVYTAKDGKFYLRSAVGQALKANKGYRAVSATPSLEGGQSAAEVTLVEGNKWKTVKEKLD